MKCNECKRKVRNSFVDKLNHVAKYHPDRIVTSLPMVANVSLIVGQSLGDKLKGLLYGVESDRKESV